MRVKDLQLTKMFSSEVKKLRASKGLTQQDVADTSRVSRATIANMEREEPAFVPSFANVVRVAASLGISVDSIIEKFKWERSK